MPNGYIHTYVWCYVWFKFKRYTHLGPDTADGWCTAAHVRSRWRAKLVLSPTPSGFFLFFLFSNFFGNPQILGSEPSLGQTS